jgi:hypothetical protein
MPFGFGEGDLELVSEAAVSIFERFDGGLKKLLVRNLH